MHLKMRPVYIIVAGILLTLIFILVSWNISFMDSKFYSPPQRYYQRSKDSQLQNKESMHWVDHLFDTLRYEKLLTEHVKSKEHLWRALKIDTSRWDRNPPNVLVYLGWVAYWDMELFATVGAPSGEFAIFADLVAGMAALGYNISIVHTICDFWDVFQNNSEAFDIIITDYDGLGTAENMGHFPTHHCKYYIVDWFGTQAPYNKRNLDLKRILTPYPFDNTNTPIHFVASQLPRQNWSTTRKDQGVLWAKQYNYLIGHEEAVQAVGSMVPLHATYGETNHKGMLPVVQHPFMKRLEFLSLLSGSKFLLGVGSPLDGPTALEAIAHGCVFINPKYKKPMNVENKPTDFLHTSQHVYVEEYIPEPYSYTIDIDDIDELKGTVRKILSTPSKPFIHPNNAPEMYIENLRKVFAKRSECVPGVTEMPTGHPSNHLFKSFEDFVHHQCDRDTGCLGHWTQLDLQPLCVEKLLMQQNSTPYHLRGYSVLV